MNFDPSNQNDRHTDFMPFWKSRILGASWPFCYLRQGFSGSHRAIYELETRTYPGLKNFYRIPSSILWSYSGHFLDQAQKIKNPPEKISYTPGKLNFLTLIFKIFLDFLKRKLFLYFGKWKPWKIFLYFKKQNFLISQ